LVKIEVFKPVFHLPIYQPALFTVESALHSTKPKCLFFKIEKPFCRSFCLFVGVGCRVDGCVFHADTEGGIFEPSIATTVFSNNKNLIKMKNVLVFILALCAFSFANAQNQPLEILLIGASHNYNKGQDMTNIHRKVLAFKPEGIFGEWLSPAEEKAAVDYWNKENVQKRTARLQAKRAIAEAKLPSVIADLEKKTAANPKDFKAKVDLAHAYYLAQDAGNGYFQSWLVAQEIKRDSNANKDLVAYFQLTLPPSVSAPYQIIDRYANDEYDLIAFPMMLKLGQSAIFPMDCQQYDPFWSEAWELSDSLANLYGMNVMRDSTTVEALQYKAILAKEKALNKARREGAGLPYGSNQVTEFLNTPFMDEWLFNQNLFNREFLTLRGYPVDAFQNKLHWWQMRNKSMCDQTIATAKTKGFKRVMMVVGSGHRWGLATLLSQMDGVKVININDFNAQ
jgi:hypothetical protein